MPFFPSCSSCSSNYSIEVFLEADMFLCLYCVKCSVTFRSLGIIGKEDGLRLKRALNKRRNSDSVLYCQRELYDITLSGERLEEVERWQRNASIWRYLENLPETLSEPSDIFDSGLSSESAMSEFPVDEGRGNYFSYLFKQILVLCYEPSGMCFCRWK